MIFPLMLKVAGNEPKSLPRFACRGILLLATLNIAALSGS
jgi:hypothetical protein